MATNPNDLRTMALMLDTWNLRHHLESNNIPDLNNLQMRIMLIPDVIRHLELIYHLPQTGDIHKMFVNYTARKKFGSIWKWIQNIDYVGTLHPIYERVIGGNSCFESDLTYVQSQTDKLAPYVELIINLTLGHDVDLGILSRPFVEIALDDIIISWTYLTMILRWAALRRGDLAFIDEHNNLFQIQFEAYDLEFAFGSGNYDFVMAVSERVSGDKFERLDRMFDELMTAQSYDHRLFFLLVEHGYDDWEHAFNILSSKADRVLAEFCAQKLTYVDGPTYVELSLLGRDILMDSMDEDKFNDTYRSASRLLRSGYVPQIRSAEFEYE